MVQQQVLIEDPTEIADILRRLPSAFYLTLSALIAWRGISTKTLADSSLIDERSIRRLKSKYCEPTLETVIALCIGLRLPPALYNDLIRKAGYSFKSTETHVAYENLLPLVYYEGLSIEAFNEALETQGIARLDD